MYVEFLIETRVDEYKQFGNSPVDVFLARSGAAKENLRC